MAVDHEKDRAALFLLDVPGIEINTRMDSGTTPLMLAAKHGMLEVVTRLVVKDADVDLRDKHGTTALGYAVDDRKEDVALFLLGTVRAADMWILPNETLEGAATHGLHRLLRATVRRLQADGADDGELQLQMALTALVAMESRRLSSLEVLVEMGLDVRTTAVQLPRGTGDYEQVVTGFTLLYAAGSCGYQEAAAFLLQCGADPLAVDSDGHLPHHFAAAHGHLPLLQWLLARCPTIPVDTTAAY